MDKYILLVALDEIIPLFVAHDFFIVLCSERKGEKNQFNNTQNSNRITNNYNTRRAKKMKGMDKKTVILIRICMYAQRIHTHTMCIYLVLKSKDGNVWIQAITFVLVHGRRKLNKWFSDHMHFIFFSYIHFRFYFPVLGVSNWIMHNFVHKNCKHHANDGSEMCPKYKHHSIGQLSELVTMITSKLAMCNKNMFFSNY